MDFWGFEGRYRHELPGEGFGLFDFTRPGIISQELQGLSPIESRTPTPANTSTDSTPAATPSAGAPAASGETSPAADTTTAPAPTPAGGTPSATAGTSSASAPAAAPAASTPSSYGETLRQYTLD